MYPLRSGRPEHGKANLRQKKERFFSTRISGIQYHRFSPYRKRTKIQPTVDDVATNSINPTVAMAFLPNFITPEYYRLVNTKAVRELQIELAPLTQIKTSRATLQQAKSMITTQVKWIPSIVDVNPYMAEMLHFICSPFHIMSISKSRRIKPTFL